MWALLSVKILAAQQIPRNFFTKIFFCSGVERGRVCQLPGQEHCQSQG
jgi:hypothetical protein